MCGRFALIADTQSLEKRYHTPQLEIELFPNNNISPGMMIPVVVDTGEIHIEQMKWGFIPYWAKDPEIGNRLINARAETIAEKPAFRKSFATKRCLIPATGFYEWGIQEDGTKRPYYIHIKDQEIMSLAGLWDEWLDAEKHVFRTCAIITTQANSAIASIHERMPVIFKDADEAVWLSEENNTKDLMNCLQPYSSSDINIKLASQGLAF